MPTKTYKFRLYPSSRQVEKFESWLSLCCELYNAGLQERKEAYEYKKRLPTVTQKEVKNISYADQNKQLTEIKKLRPEMNEVNSHVLQEALDRLDKSFKAFFRRVKSGEKPGYPRFRSFRRYDSISCPNTRYKIQDGKLDLSRFGKIKIKQDCEIKGKLKTLIIKREIDKWFACIAVEFEPEKLPVSTESIGLDMGLKSFAVFSNGQEKENPRWFKEMQARLRIAQRRVSRRKKGSNRRRKAVIQLKKLHLKIRNQRTDFQHKLSESLVARYGFIAIEDLNIKGLSGGMLAKSVNDAAWNGFFQKLIYKAENAGRELVKVNPSGTSQTCVCGASVPKTLADRIHICDSCGLEGNRDHISAQVILQRAQAGRSGVNVGH